MDNEMVDFFIKSWTDDRTNTLIEQVLKIKFPDLKGLFVWTGDGSIHIQFEEGTHSENEIWDFLNSFKK